jgi:outer membrane protein
MRKTLVSFYISFEDVYLSKVVPVWGDYMFQYALLGIVLGLVLISGTVRAQDKPPHDDGLSLQSVLRHVYDHDPGLQSARAGLHAAHELYPQALAGRRPTLNTQTSIYTTHIESSNFSQGTGATTKDASVNLDQPVYTSGRTDAQVDKANNLVKAAYAAYLQTEQELLYDTARIYTDVVRDRELLRLGQENQRILTTEYDAVNERFTGGDLTRTDVEQTAARLARAQANVLSARRGLETSYAQFEGVTGFLPDGTLFYPVPAFVFPETLDVMFEMATRHNQTLQEARYQLAAAQDDIDANIRELLPDIRAFASYDKQYDPQPGITSESETQTIGLRATMVLYQGGALRSRIRESKSLARQRQYAVTDAEQQTRAEILEAWKTLKMTQQEMDIRRNEIKASKIAREGVKEEAHMGERTTLDILDADQEVLSAEIAYVQARHDSIVAAFSLARLLGIFSPEAIGLGDIAYDPGDHYRAAGDKVFSLSDE